jgi:hypothetical protein
MIWWGDGRGALQRLMFLTALAWYGAEILPIHPEPSTMRTVINRHERELLALPEAVGRLLDSLGSDEDRLWPSDAWPRQVRSGPMAPGTEVRHGPIRYRITGYEPGRWIRYTFTAPVVFHGYPEFTVLAPQHDRCILQHTLAMKTSLAGALQWHLVLRPLHDALIEDAQSRAEHELGVIASTANWSTRVRSTRRLLARRPSRQIASRRQRTHEPVVRPD